MDVLCEETRREANEKIDKTTRELQVLRILSEYEELTAQEVARYMAYRGMTKEVDYNHARPRLTKLLENREVCIVGKKEDQETHCKAVVYQITQKGKARIKDDL